MTTSSPRKLEFLVHECDGGDRVRRWRIYPIGGDPTLPQPRSLGQRPSDPSSLGWRPSDPASRPSPGRDGLLLLLVDPSLVKSKERPHPYRCHQPDGDVVFLLRGRGHRGLRGAPVLDRHVHVGGRVRLLHALPLPRLGDAPPRRLAALRRVGRALPPRLRASTRWPRSTPPRTTTRPPSPPSGRPSSTSSTSTPPSSRTYSYLTPNPILHSPLKRISSQLQSLPRN